MNHLHILSVGFFLFFFSSFLLAQPVPDQASAVCYTQMVFNDDFASDATIDKQSTGASEFKWYIDRPFGWADVPNTSYSVANSTLKLSETSGIDPKAGWWLSSYSTKAKRGKAFRYGYFECRMRFDGGAHTTANWFPCWWGFSVSHSAGTNNTHWGELDFFEAYKGANTAYNGNFVCTVHDWQPIGLTHYQNSNNSHPNPTNYNEWHTYGCLWTPESITWYFDNTLIASLVYSAINFPNPQSNPTSSKTGTFSILDIEYLQLVLGTATNNWPLEIDWVRVWQNPNSILVQSSN